MDTVPEDEHNITLLSVMARVFAVAGAVICCYLLYRFAQGFWHNYRRPGWTGRRRIPDRRNYNGRKDVSYTRLGDVDEPFEDEDEGYHDPESIASPSIDKLWPTERPLPDKPLPPLPDASPS